MRLVQASRAPLTLALALAGALFAAAPGAQAQSIMAQVNNRAITGMDVAQRVRIAALVDRRRLGSREALEELIDDQAKIIEASRIGYRINDEGVDNEFNKIAKSNGQNPREFEDVLRRSGLEPSAVRDKLRANLAWQALLRDRVKLGTQVTRAEVESAAGERKRGERVVEYSLIPVVFVVPPGASPGSRVASANAARAKFTGCDNGFDSLRSMPDVFVRPMIVRTSGDLTKPLAALLDKTPVGKMTPPAAGEQGIESIAVCSKRDTTGSEASDTAAVAESIAEKKVQTSSKAYLAEIRKKVTIRYHR